MPTVTLRSDQLWTIGAHRVYTSPSLGTEWTPRDYLYCDQLTLAAAPAIDQAILRYDLGDYVSRVERAHSIGVEGAARFGGPGRQVPFTSLSRQYVKVEILDGNREVNRTWYGRIETDGASYHYDAGGQRGKTGVQAFNAFGLLADLDRTPILSSRLVDASTTDVRTVHRGLGFNVRRNGATGQFGNRSAFQDDGVYNFRNELSEPTTASHREWKAGEAVEYLQVRHFPDDITWQIEGSLAALNWYRIAVETDRRSVKEVLDELINRRRIVGYHVYGEEDGAEFIGKLKLFTFTATDITTTPGVTIPANTDTVELNLLGSNLVQNPQLTNVATQTADTLIVEGEPIVSVSSMQFSSSKRGLTLGWTSAQQTAYKAAEGTDEDENTKFREKDAYRDVFARFVVPYDFAGIVDNPAGGDGVKLTIHQDDLPARDSMPALLAELFTEKSPYRKGALYPEDSRFLAAIPYAPDEDDDDTPPKLKPPFVVFETDTDVWTFADKLNAPPSEREWACSLDVLHDQMGVRVEVNKAGGQQLVASSQWAGAAAAPDELDPDIASNFAVDYASMWMTFGVQWESRCRVERELSTPTGIKRTQVIRVADAHLWFELPGTITDVASDGQLVTSEGRILRDDRDKLEAIATAAAEWYGQARQTLKVMFKDTTPDLQIGQLITALTTGALSEPVNTVVTGLVFNLKDHSCAIETSYADADFS